MAGDEFNKLSGIGLMFIPEAVIMMLPLLVSFPLEGFVFNMAADPYFTARKQLSCPLIIHMPSRE